MKVKRSKHVVNHGDGYTPVVRCTLNRRHKVSGSRREESWCTGVSVAFPQKVDIEQMAIDINHATTATPTDVKLVWDALRTAITDALCEGHRVQLGGLGSLTMEPNIPFLPFQGSRRDELPLHSEYGYIGQNLLDGDRR